MHRSNVSSAKSRPIATPRTQVSGRHFRSVFFPPVVIKLHLALKCIVTFYTQGRVLVLTPIVEVEQTKASKVPATDSALALAASLQLSRHLHTLQAHLLQHPPCLLPELLLGHLHVLIWSFFFFQAFLKVTTQTVTLVVMMTMVTMMTMVMMTMTMTMVMMTMMIMMTTT